MAAFGLCVAGLVTGPRDLVSYLAARRTGVCRRRGLRDVVVRRDEEPDRFRRLLRNRVLGLVRGFGLIAAGVALGLFILAVRMGWISAYAAQFAPPPHAPAASTPSVGFQTVESVRPPQISTSNPLIPSEAGIQVFECCSLADKS